MAKNVLFLQKMHFFCLKYLVYKDFFVTLQAYLIWNPIIHIINNLKTLFIMNKLELIKAAAAKAEVSAALAAKVIDAALEASVEAVKKGEGLQLIGYATIGYAQRAARKAKNPRTGAIVNVPAKKVVKIKPGAKFAL